MEESPSPSISTDASDGDDEGEMGRGPLDHLPDIGETVPGALACSPALPGGGRGADPRSAIARSRAEADMPEARALGKCTVSLVGSAAVAEATRRLVCTRRRGPRFRSRSSTRRRRLPWACVPCSSPRLAPSASVTALGCSSPGRPAPLRSRRGRQVRRS